MKCVGWEGNPAFDQRVFAEIYEATGGVPRRINQIVNRLLLLGAVDQRTRIDGEMLSRSSSEWRTTDARSRPSAQPAAGSARPAGSSEPPGASLNVLHPVRRRVDAVQALALLRRLSGRARRADRRAAAGGDRIANGG
jgi:general secretion pathway protein A